MFIENEGEFVAWGGTTEQRRRGRTPVAESKATIKVEDEATLQRCLDAIEASDRRLAMPKAVGDIDPYDWTIVWKDTAADGSGNIHFGVVWYDEEYYQGHRETFKGRFHDHLFGKLGISAEDFTVTHWKKEQDAVAA